MLSDGPAVSPQRADREKRCQPHLGQPPWANTLRHATKLVWKETTASTDAVIGHSLFEHVKLRSSYAITVPLQSS